MDKNQREARRHQEDMALNRGLLWVGGAIILECLLLLVNRYYINYMVSEVDVAILFMNGMRAVRIVGTAAAVLGLVWAVLRFRKGQKVGAATAAALACGAVAVCCHVALTFQENGMRMLFLLVPAWAGLALVYYLYQREFFLGAVASGLSVLGLWFVRYKDGLGLESVLCLLGIVLVTAEALWLKQNGGVIRRADGEEIRVLSKKAVYAPVLASGLIGLTAVLLGGFLGGSITYYLIFAMVAWLFALLVFYTVKLM